MRGCRDALNSTGSELRPCTLCSFMANLVLVQYIEQGPRWIATALQARGTGARVLLRSGR